jgi:outer membrane protein assembly factor BamD (BamD/ComL family)
VFGQLVDNYPSSPLCRAAHEELALLWETRGRLDRALDEYYILGYKPDIAFFLDARMSTDEVRDYLRGHWHSPRRRELMHALALRCMRDERWEEAKRLLRTLPKTAYAAYNPHPDDWWLDKPSPDPLHALSDLSRLQAAIGRARSQQSRAAAMYAYASYYYSHGTLLLYNAQLWQGDRAAAFAWWWNTRHATKQDTLLAHKHMYDHEVYARCMRICQEIARRYPRSSEAPMAMYRTACCMERLANFNDWWRQENTNARLLKKAIHWMKQVYIQYPHDRLAPSARKYAAVFADEALQRY